MCKIPSPATHKKGYFLKPYTKPWWAVRARLLAYPWRSWMVWMHFRRPERPRLERKGYKKRKRFTSKQRPLLNLFLLQAPWRRARYKLKTEAARLDSHARAFCMYYRIDEEYGKRVFRSIRYRTQKVMLLFNRFERRLDVALVRLGWAPSFSTAREWVESGTFSAERLSSVWGWQGFSVGSDFRLIPGDRLRALDRSLVARTLRRRYSHTYWRFGSRFRLATPRPVSWNPRLFYKYKREKYARPWLRFLRYFVHNSPSFSANYNTLTAVYRPKDGLLDPFVRYPMFLGRGLYFWREAARHG